MRILNKKEIREIERIVLDSYGVEISLNNFAVLITGKENKIWLATKEIFEIDLDELRIQAIGLYFGRIDKGKLRLSVEGAQMIGEKAKKNVCEINDVKSFLSGFDVKPSKVINCEERAFVIVKNNNDILGIAKYENGLLKNVLPKSRRIAIR